MGAILRSRATWFEQGGKSNKYFLNFETHKKDPRVLFVRSLPKTAFLPLILKEFVLVFIRLTIPRSRISRSAETSIIIHNRLPGKFEYDLV